MSYTDKLVEITVNQLAHAKLRKFSAKLDSMVYGFANYENPLSTIPTDVEESMNNIKQFMISVFEKEADAEVEGRIITLLRGPL